MMAVPRLSDVAHALFERGFHVIPLNGKKALVRWEEFQRRAPTEDEVTAWWARWPNANVGIITGIQVVVIDADDEQAREFMESGAVTRTPWKVKTPRGWHYYYAINAALTLTNAAGNGLDARGVGGYVVAAGSVGYEWAVDMAYGADSWQDLPVLTPQDVAAINRYRGGAASAASSSGEPIGPSLADLASVHIPHDASPTSEGGRNNALASLVGQWIAQGMVLSDILAHARIWNASNLPPLPDAELIQTVTSISIGHGRRHGEQVPLTPSTAPAGALRVFTLGDLEDDPPALPETFWGHGVLFRGARLLLGGAPKVGKSRFFLSMAVAAAVGGAFMGVQFERPIRVLWIQAEINISFVRERIEALILDMTDDQVELVRANLAVTGRLDLDLTQATDRALVDEAMRSFRPDFTCFDPAINFSTADENRNTEVRALLRAVDALGAAHDCATALVHHIRKDVLGGVKGMAGEGASFEAIRGASAFRGWYDTGILLGGDSHNTTVAYECRNAASPAAHVASFNATTGRYEVADLSAFNDDDQETPSHTSPNSRQRRPLTSAYGSQEAGPDQDQGDGETRRSRLDVRMENVMRMISEAPGGILAAELKHRCEVAFNIKTSVAESILTALTRSGAVTKTRVGFNSVRYSIASTGRATSAQPVDNLDGEHA